MPRKSKRSVGEGHVESVSPAAAKTDVDSEIGVELADHQEVGDTLSSATGEQQLHTDHPAVL